jgi:phage-related baseplate assembly protein
MSGEAFAEISLDALPRPAIVEVLDVEALIAARKAQLIALYPACAAVLALESEPLTKIVEAGAYRELMLRQRYNEEALAVTLAFALGLDLDHIGLTYYQEPRLEITPAVGSTPAVLETDAAYRRRLQLKPASWSTAGPRDAYLFHTLSAHIGVADAGVYSPYPGTTIVAVLGTTPDGAPSQEALDAVTARLNDLEVRPLCETVVIQSVQVRAYVAHVTIYTYPGADAAQKVSEATAALQSLVDSLYKVGLDVSRSSIAAAAHVAGVQRVDVARPVEDMVCDATQIARCTWVDVQWGGTAQ